MQEWLRSLPPEEQLNQLMARLAVMTRGYQLNGIGCSINGEDVAPGEIRVSFIFGVATPEDEKGEIIFGINRDDLVSLEHQFSEEEKYDRPFAEVSSDDEIVDLYSSVIKGRRVETFNFRPLEEGCEISLWFTDGSKFRFKTRKGPIGVPRGRVMIRENGVLMGELPFSEDSGYYLASSEAGSEG